MTSLPYPKSVPVPLALVAVLSLATGGWGAPYTIVAGSKGNFVKFTSKAPLESFEGETANVSGALDCDVADLGNELELEVAVDLASLDTGIALRDRHLRENHLHTDEFPTATFRGGKIVEGAGGSLSDGETQEILLEGELDLHGVTRTVRVPIELTLERDGAIRIVSRFPVALSDHAIPRPRFLWMKLGEEQKVAVDVRARPKAAPTTSP